MLISTPQSPARIAAVEDELGTFLAGRNLPGGFLGIENDGIVPAQIIHRTGTAAEISAIVLATGELAITTDTHELRLGDGATSGGRSIVVRTDALVTVYPNGTPAENGTALRNAYIAAGSMTPGGSALSATNRATVLLMPGRYDVTGSTWTIGTSYVDLVGVGSSRLTSIVSGEVSLSSRDFRLVGLSIANSSAVTIFTTIGGNPLLDTQWDDVVLSTGPSVSPGATLVGTYRRVRTAGGSSFSALGAYTAAAKWIDCEFLRFGNLTTGRLTMTDVELIRVRHTGTSSNSIDFGGLMDGCDFNTAITRLASTARIYRSRIKPTSGAAINHNASGMTASIAYCLLGGTGIGSNVTNNLTDTNIVDDDI